jgi:hypothetical protein
MHIAKLICVLGFFGGGGGRGGGGAGERRAHLIYESTKTRKIAFKFIFNVVCGIVRSFTGVHTVLSCCGLAERMGFPGHSYGTQTAKYISLALDRFFFEPVISKSLACSWSQTFRPYSKLVFF